jgi:hypothetical protein
LSVCPGTSPCTPRCVGTNCPKSGNQWQYIMSDLATIESRSSRFKLRTSSRVSGALPDTLHTKEWLRERGAGVNGCVRGGGCTRGAHDLISSSVTGSFLGDTRNDMAIFFRGSLAYALQLDPQWTMFAIQQRTDPGGPGRGSTLSKLKRMSCDGTSDRKMTGLFIKIHRG